jgi:Rrf2 family protein
MIITRKSDYALRAVDYLARFEKEHPSSNGNATTVQLAKDMEIPYRFLRSIIKELCTANIVKSQRGNLGGIRLARPESDISIYDVIMAIDAKALAVNQCTLHSHCSRKQVCTIHKKMTKLQHMINEQLSDIRFSDSV